MLAEHFYPELGDCLTACDCEAGNNKRKPRGYDVLYTVVRTFLN